MTDSGTVTKIAVQRRRRNRFSIYLDNEFAFGLDMQVAVRLNLNKGDVLSADDVARILQQEEIKQTKESAFRYLARRAHSERELKTKLGRKGYSPAIVADIITQLKEDGHIDDLDFARGFSRSRLASKPMGAKRLRSELWQKGVGEKIIDQVVAEAYRAQTEAELAKTLAQKQASRYVGLDENMRKKRLHDFLLRRGFGWDVVSEAVGAMMYE